MNQGEGSTTTNNVAGNGATIGIQADYVHNSTVYIIHPDASPAEIYRVGVRYLEDGVPSAARQHIGDAIARGFDPPEARFHLTLALLSKRSLRDLSSEEREALRSNSAQARKSPADDWTRALKAVDELLARLGQPHSDPAEALRGISLLPRIQHDAIVRHLDLVITGSAKDSFWVEIRRQAEEAQFANDRSDRVWAYFQPDPAEPRSRRPEAPDVRFRHHLLAWGCTGVALVAAARLVSTATSRVGGTVAIASLLAIATAYICVRTGFHWRYRSDRLRSTERRLNDAVRAVHTRSSTVNRAVEHAFDYYFRKYRPGDKDDLGRWLHETRRIRAALVIEISELYSDDRIPVDRIRWLIRYLVKDVRCKWRKGQLDQHRVRYEVSRSTRTWCMLSLLAHLAATSFVIIEAIGTDAVLSSAATLLFLACGQAALRRHFSITAEKRRFREEVDEHRQSSEERSRELRRWRDKIDSTRPAEKEMETWLRSDRTLALHEALTQYRLAWREIIAHTFLHTPAKGAKRARVPHGPLRYTRYEVRIFLITPDGVREVSTELDFYNGTFNGQERHNFRFDAVSSVQVTRAGHNDYALELTLMNGPSNTIEVVVPTAPDAENDHSAGPPELNLDATGFTHTLRILEGIAAEGKSWISRDLYSERISPEAAHPSPAQA